MSLEFNDLRFFKKITRRDYIWLTSAISLKREEEKENNLMFKDIQYFLFLLSRDVECALHQDMDFNNIPTFSYLEKKKEEEDPTYKKEKEEMHKILAIQKMQELKEHSNFKKK